MYRHIICISHSCFNDIFTGEILCFRTQVTSFLRSLRLRRDGLQRVEGLLKDMKATAGWLWLWGNAGFLKSVSMKIGMVFVRESPIEKWMIYRGTPIFGNPQMNPLVKPEWLVLMDVHPTKYGAILK